MKEKSTLAIILSGVSLLTIIIIAVIVSTNLYFNKNNDETKLNDLTQTVTPTPSTNPTVTPTPSEGSNPTPTSTSVSNTPIPTTVLTNELKQYSFEFQLETDTVKKYRLSLFSNNQNIIQVDRQNYGGIAGQIMLSMTPSNTQNVYSLVVEIPYESGPKSYTTLSHLNATENINTPELGKVTRVSYWSVASMVAEYLSTSNYSATTNCPDLGDTFKDAPCSSRPIIIAQSFPVWIKATCNIHSESNELSEFEFCNSLVESIKVEQI